MAIGKRALKEFHIGGVHSTIPFHRYMLKNDIFKSGKFTLRFVDELLEEEHNFVTVVTPGGPSVRVDTSCYSGYKIPPNYDSLIAKLIVKGKDRKSAMAIGKRALKEFHIGGVHSTIPFHRYMLKNDIFKSGKFTLRFVDELLEEEHNFEEEELPV